MRRRKRRLFSLTSFIRVWLPVLVVLAGLISIAVDPTIDGLEGAAHIIGAGLAIWLLNFLVRIGISGERERTAEADARTYFMRHGHWPDEAPAGGVEPEAPPRRPAPTGHRGQTHRRDPHRVRR